MSLHMLSSKNYSDSGKDYGDCTVIIHNGKAVVYDCGSVEHAEQVIKLLKQNGISMADCILSHNDDDHYKGFEHLIKNGYVKGFYTIDVMSYKNDILNAIGDKRKSDNSIEEQIDKTYDNLSALSDLIQIRDIYKYKHLMPSFISFVGPEKDYFINATAKGLDTREGDYVDSATFTNASSIQIKVNLGNTCVMLNGDCAIEAIPENVDFKDYNYLQIPHHGNEEVAESLFDRVGNYNDVTYLVSDNKGNAKGGSDNLVKKGYSNHSAENTKNGTINVNNVPSAKTTYIRRTPLGLWNIL